METILAQPALVLGSIAAIIKAIADLIEAIKKEPESES